MHNFEIGCHSHHKHKDSRMGKTLYLHLTVMVHGHPILWLGQSV